MEDQPAAEDMAALQYEDISISPERYSLLVRLDKRPKPLPSDIVNLLQVVAAPPDQACCICNAGG
eukprot:12402329-Karenia_brevis.AAC.2